MGDDEPRFAQREEDAVRLDRSGEMYRLGLARGQIGVGGDVDHRNTP